MLKRDNTKTHLTLGTGMRAHIRCSMCRRLTQNSSHRKDEQLQQCVLFLIGQTQEAQLGHFGEVKDSSPYYLIKANQSISVKTFFSGQKQLKHILLNCMLSLVP